MSPMTLQRVAEGALFAMGSPLAIAAVLAAGLAAAPRSLRAAGAGAIVLAASCLLVLVLPDSWPAAPANAAVLVALGALVAAGQRLPRARALFALVPGGIAAGFAAGLGTATPSEAAGSAGLLGAIAAVLLLLRAGVRLPSRVQRGAAMARRMAGAWIAAIGVLMFALWLRGGA